MRPVLVAVGVAATVLAAPGGAQGVRVLDLGHGIYEAIGVAVGTGGQRTVATPASNTFLVTTAAGNVVIDTSLAPVAPSHKLALSAKSMAPVKAIILTHAHGDHIGGVGIWRGPDTQIIAQQNHQDFMRYQRRLAGFFAGRNAAQFGRPPAAPAGPPAAWEPTHTLDRPDTLTVGDVMFELLHTPGETPDHLTVWIPQFKIAFIEI